MRTIDQWRENSPFGLRRYADEFTKVGEAALNQGQDVSFAAYYNFLHGVELGLKSYLLQVGAEGLQSLRRGYGHNLARLLDKSIDHDLRTRCPSLTNTHIDAIKGSSELYKNKQFEYISIGGIQLMPIDHVAAAAKALITGLNTFPMRTALGTRRSECAQVEQTNE